MSVHVNRAELAVHMGVSEPTVDRWVREGMPALTRGGKGVQWKFDLPAVIKWWGNRRAEAAAGETQTDEAELKRRKLAAEAGKAELEFAKAKDEVAPVREFERAQAAMFAAIRTNIMNVPQRVVTQLLGETNETTFKDKLRAELALALEMSASEEISLDDEEDDDEDNNE